MPKEDIKKALDEARRLEAEEIPSDEEIAEQYRNDMQKAAKAAKLLKPVRVYRRKK